MIDKFTEQHIKATAKITDVLAHYNITLNRQGSGYVAKCPYHNDRRPSLCVNVRGNYCKCFACGAGADPVKLVRDMEGVSYGEALRILAAMYNIPVEAQPAQRIATRRIPAIKPRPVEIEQAAPPTYTDPALMERSKLYECNPLYAYIASLFGEQRTRQTLTRYNVGTARYKVCPQQGERCSVVFWQVDEAGNVRGGKIVPYDERTGKRIRGDRAVSWSHTAAKLSGYNLQQCLYGQHLITADTARVNIVEAEKTAILADLYTAGKLGVWVATGGKDTTTSRRRILAAADLLRGKQVILYPDADGVTEWEALREELTAAGVNAHIGALPSTMDADSKADVGDWIVERVTATRTAAPATPVTSTATPPATPAPTTPAKDHITRPRVITLDELAAVIYNPLVEVDSYLPF